MINEKNSSKKIFSLISEEIKNKKLILLVFLGLVFLTRIIFLKIPDKNVDIQFYKTVIVYILLFLPALFLGIFSPEKKEKIVLEGKSSTIFWVKFFSGLLLLIILAGITILMFPKLIIKYLTELYPTELERNLLLPILILIEVYTFSFFSSLLIRKTLISIIFIPFILSFTFFILYPFLLPLSFYSPYPVLYFLVPFFVFTGLVLIWVFIIWIKTISKGIKPWKLFFKIAFIYLILSFGLNALFNLKATMTLEKVKKEAKNKNIKIYPEEVIPPEIPDQENAAIVLNKAFELMDKLKKEYKKEWEFMPFEGKYKLEELTDEHKKIISQLMDKEEFKEFFNLVEKAVNMEKCRFNINYEEGYNLLLPHLSKMRGLARILSARIYLLLWEKRYKEAVNLLKNSMKLADCLKDEPILVSQLVRVTIDRIMGKSIERVLNSPYKISSKDCKDLIFIIDGKDKDITKGFEGELAIFAYYFFNKQELFFSQRPKLLYFYNSYLFNFAIKEWYASHIKKIIEIIEMSQKPYYLVKEKSKPISSLKRVNLKNIFSLTLVPSIYHSFSYQASYIANLDILKISLGLRIYKNEYGEYPENLAYLIDKVFPSLPEDPFTGKNYIYKRQGEGFLIYSIGENGKDDKGIYNIKEKKDDIAIFIER